MNDGDPLQTLLRNQREPALADEGFSERVLDALPRIRRSAARTRRWILGAGGAIGGLATALLAPPVAAAFGQESGIEPLVPFLTVAFMAVLAACAAWSFVAADFRERMPS